MIWVSSYSYFSVARIYWGPEKLQDNDRDKEAERTFIFFYIIGVGGFQKESQLNILVYYSWKNKWTKKLPLPLPQFE